jgi:hypothetical protein
MDIRQWIVKRHHLIFARVNGNPQERWWRGNGFYKKMWEKLNGRVPEWSEGDLLFEDYFSSSWYVDHKHKIWLVWRTNKLIRSSSMNRLAVFCFTVMVHYWLVAALATAWWCILKFVYIPLGYAALPFFKLGVKAWWTWEFFVGEFVKFCSEFLNFLLEITGLLAR